MTPPGYKTANGTTVPCEDGSFRSGWAPLGLATTCTSCGTGVRASKTDRVLKYDLASNAPIQVEITTSSDDCCKLLLGCLLCHGMDTTELCCPLDLITALKIVCIAAGAGSQAASADVHVVP